MNIKLYMIIGLLLTIIICKEIRINSLEKMILNSENRVEVYREYWLEEIRLANELIKVTSRK